jgi:recombination protein RecA
MKQDKELELALAKIESQFGKGTIIDSTHFVNTDIEVIPTGNYALDKALGVGGIPCGRITEIFGGEAQGKSLLALTMTANAQRLGHKVLYVDAEHDLDPTWASFIGVDMEKLMIHQPETGEQGLEVAHMLIKTGGVKLVIIDSVAAMTPKSIIEGEMDDNTVAALPRLFSKALSKMRGDIKRTETALVLLNQVRDKIGFMQSGVDSPGGRAIKFYSSVRIKITRTGDLVEGGAITGTKIKAKTLKNKVASPHKECTYNIVDGFGFDIYADIIDDAVKAGIVLKSGSWYYFPAINTETGEITKGDAIGNGYRQIREKLSTDHETLGFIMKELKEAEING